MTAAARPGGGGRRGGFSLVELMLALILGALLMTRVAPEFTTVAESARMQRCAADLRSAWIAQRLYRLEHGEFASDVRSLRAADPLPGLRWGEIEGYSLDVRHDVLGRGRIVARREPGAAWSGQLSIDTYGRISGELTHRDGDTLQP